MHKPVINSPQLKIKEKHLSDTEENMILHQVKILESILLPIIMILNPYSKRIKKSQKEKHSGYRVMYKIKNFNINFKLGDVCNRK